MKETGNLNSLNLKIIFILHVYNWYNGVVYRQCDFVSTP